MTTTHRACVFVAFAATCLPACSTHHIVCRPNQLKPGITYEVRKPVAAGDTFNPRLLSGYFFIIEEPRPPLLAAGNSAKGTRISVRTTAYCHNESDHLAYGRLTARGTYLRYGAVRSAAADWSRFPAGTRFRIAGEPGVIYEVDDYGSALVGTGTIDLYKPTRGLMNSWGVRNVDIEVLQWGSFENSLRLMQGRTHHPHVRQMFLDIQRRLGQANGPRRSPPATAMAPSGTSSLPL